MKSGLTNNRYRRPCVTLHWKVHLVYTDSYDKWPVVTFDFEKGVNII